MAYNFEVHKPNLGQMQDYLQDQDKKKNSGGDKNSDDFITWWDFPSGLSVLRVLPPWDPTGRVALPVFSHRIEFQGEGMKYKRYNWTCPNATFGKPCKICDVLTELSASGVSTDDWGPWNKKFYFNALVIHDPIYHDEVVTKGKNPKDVPGVAPGTHVLVKSPKTIYDWIVAQITNPMIGDLTDIGNGIDIYVTKEGKGLGTKYQPTLSPNGRQPVLPEYLDKLTKMHNPDEIFGVGYEDKVIDELVTHLQRSSGVFNSGALQQTHANMGGYAPPVAPAPAFGGVPQAPPVTAPPVAPTVPKPQEHIDVAGNVYHLIDNAWVLVQAAPPAVPAPPPVPVAPPVPVPPTAPVAPPLPVAPPVPSAPIAPPVAPPVPPMAPPVPQAPMVNTAPPVGAPPSAPADSTDQKPLCFGQHNPTDIKCVVCPFESSCTQVSPK